MNTLTQLFELIADHPFVSLFLVLCIGWIIESAVSLIKTRIEMNSRRELDQKQIEEYQNKEKQSEDSDI